MISVAILAPSGSNLAPIWLPKSSFFRLLLPMSLQVDVWTPSGTLFLGVCLRFNSPKHCFPSIFHPFLASKFVQNRYDPPPRRRMQIYGNAQIKINKNVKVPYFRNTFWHSLVHCITRSSSSNMQTTDKLPITIYMSGLGWRGPNGITI